MNPLMNSTYAAAHGSGAAGQPSVTDVAQLNKDEVMAAWNHLKLQVNRFADKNLIVHLMKQEVQQEDIRYAVDRGFPDRVYVASTFHFDEAGVALPYPPPSRVTPSGSDAAVGSTSSFRAPNYVNGTTRAGSVSKPRSKSKPRRPGEIKRRAATKTANLPSITSPVTSSVTSVYETSEAISGAEDDMIGGDIAVDNHMSPEELMPHYAIYNSPAPVVSGDGVTENLENAIQLLLNDTYNSAVVFGRETNVPGESAAGIHDTFKGGESSFELGPLLNGNIDPTLHEYQPPISEPPFDGGSDHDSLFGDYSEAPGYNMTANDWMDIMNKENFSTP
ncbi:hypothetical protein DL762_006438 [Monosporascus cannonballus]|uniref:Clr5 domain-containing protein n=1 Tax=Monosporascus cannonballus TaxID=155416 RepID=A0ABY0H538_9PEZI|nr:hypothetical protein DL762_006438 [Monosporascus cannonballus]